MSEESLLQKNRPHWENPDYRPAGHPISAPFWEWTRRHELRLQQCVACGHREFPPQAACSRCLSELTWERVRGTGTVYSYSVVSRPATPGVRVPYVLAIVELDEGPRMLTNIVGVEPAEVKIGMQVRVEFVDLEQMTVYPFRPSAEGRAPA